ncbi:MAG TPA: AAA family ATPase, partial [Candidatus Paceibacterota bacterium]
MKEEPSKLDSENGQHLYADRSRRDLAVTAIPEILWQARTIDGESEGATTVSKESARVPLDARLMELYALSQEYVMEPVDNVSVTRSMRIDALADMAHVSEDQYLASLQGLLAREEQDFVGPPDESRDTKAKVTARREYLRKSILDLMSDQELRLRYEAEVTHERAVRHSGKTQVNLKEIISTRSLRGRLQSERRRLRIEELFAREEVGNAKRPKTPGRTPQAVAVLERGIALSEKKENEIVGKLTSPERGLLATEMLLAGKRELETKGFVMTPSREQIFSEIADLTAQGFRVFLGGPTGTGKTAIALFALKELTDGSFSWVTWTGETSVRDLFGSPKLTTNQETGKLESSMTKGPMTRAVIGEKRGILHEELTSGQTNVQMSMKTIWSSRQGEQINLPGFNGTEFTKEEIVELATGNLKGKRHQERESMDPAIAREMKAIDVPFMPASEMRDIILMEIIDRSGLMPISRADIDMVEQFCKAAELSQLAYLEEIPDVTKQTDLYKIISPSGEAVALTSVFLDTGTVRDLFKGWRASGESLSSYLEVGLRRFVEANPHFRELRNECQILKNILRAYGFCLDSTPSSEFFIPIGGIKTESRHPYLRPTELGFLIPGAPPSEADEFSVDEGVPDCLSQNYESAGLTFVIGQIYVKDGMEMIFKGVSSVDGRPIFTEISTPDSPEVKSTGEVTLVEARALISPELFRGPKEVERVFGFQPEVPPILFTRSELERAKELGQRLVLRSAKDGAGQPLSPARMQEILAPKWQDANQGVLDTPERWSNLIGPDRMSTETARGGWALVSPDLLPGTLSQNYFEQTDTLIAELKKTYQNIPLPDQYTKAIQEYEAQKDELLTLAGDDVTWQEATRRLSELAITQLLRANLSEDLFDLLVERGMTGTSPRQNMYNWTSSLSR